MRIGVLTGGGDCPGLNAAIRAIVRRAIQYGDDVVGIRHGWRGWFNDEFVPLGRKEISGILHRGGTILGTSRTNPYKKIDGEQTIIQKMKEQNIDVLIPIGGEDTLGVAAKLSKAGVKLVGIPKTIDNDLNGTDYTFGFDTAINIATEAIDRIHTTAESHDRVIVVEVMGRHAGWIALYSGLAGGADMILIPEEPFSIEKVCDSIKRRHENGKNFSIVVAAEGAKIDTSEDTDKDGSFVLASLEKDAFGHIRLGGIADIIAIEIERRLGYESRSTVLGHIQRGGSPTAMDRVLGTRFGIHAVEMVHKNLFGRMAALRGKDIVDVDLQDAVGTLKTVDKQLYEVANVFFE